MAKKGRPSKGERDFIGLRPSAELGALVRQYAADHGLSITDVATRALAREMGRDDLAPPVPPRRADQELPLTG